MPIINNKEAAEKASDNQTFSRRGFFLGAASSATVVALPAAFAAEIPPLSDDEQVSVLVAQLQKVLHRMQPIVDRSTWNLHWYTDGTFYLMMQGFRRYEEFSGLGPYDLSIGGIEMTYWVINGTPVRESDGKPVPECTAFYGLRWYEGEYVDSWRWFGSELKIVRKLEGIEAPDA